MLAPRWRKVLRDLWRSKTRTILVVISIAVGVFAVGMIGSSKEILSRELAASYLASNPAGAEISTPILADDMLHAIRRLPEVRDVEQRSSATVRVQAGLGVWRNLRLVAASDYADIRIGKINPQQGAWPPPEREVLIERASLGWLGAQMGDTLLVELPDGKQRRLRIAGLAHDVSRSSPMFNGTATGFITRDTLDWLGGAQGNTLMITVVRDTGNSAHVRKVAEQVREKIEKTGYSVPFIYVAARPNEHPMNMLVQPMVLVLGVLAVFSLVLSGFLIINTISALLAQQTRQIGVMKAIGGREDQIVALYLGTILIYSILALVIAVPLGAIGARAFTGFMAGFLNADIADFRIPPAVLLQQAVAGLLVPLLAGLYPILAGTRITVREATGSAGLGQGRPGRGNVLGALRVPGLGRPTLLSLRNTFRRTGRLLLTLTTLTLAGAMFISVLSVRESLLATAESTFSFFNHDIQIDLDRFYRVERLEAAARSVPGVVSVESRCYAGARILRADGSESDNIYVVAAPSPTTLRPTLIRGRWLQPGDGNALVVNSDIFREDPQIDVGSEVVLKIGGRETTWQVVGVIQAVLNSVPPVPFVYADYTYYSRVTRNAGQASQLAIQTAEHDWASQERVAKALEAQLKGEGIRTGRLEAAGATRVRIESLFGTIVSLLLVMAVLLAAVGGLGLMGTMSLNVLERTREIGVMRAIGAPDGAVRQIVIVEGVLIGLLSWLAGVLLALPMSRLFSDQVGLSLLSMRLDYTFSPVGALLWLGIVVIIAAVASLLPAQRASRLTVREVLAYE